jgi:hypothetical protein
MGNAKKVLVVYSDNCRSVAESYVLSKESVVGSGPTSYCGQDCSACTSRDITEGVRKNEGRRNSNHKKG